MIKEIKTEKSFFKVTFLACLLAMAVVLQFLEIFFVLPIPGVKLGLANIITLIALFFFDYKIIFYLIVGRVFLSSLLLGNILGFSFYLSLSGAIMSFIVMFILKRSFYPLVSEIGISVIGSVIHLLAQVLVVMFFVHNFFFFRYFFYVLPFAVLTGLMTGIGTKLMLKHLRGIFDRKFSY